MFISVHLFRQFFGPSVSVGMASIPDLALSRGSISLPMSHDLPFAEARRPLSSLLRKAGKVHYAAFQRFCLTS